MSKIKLMNIFAGKTPTERNKIIAAGVLGLMSLFSLYLAFGGSIFSSRKTTVSVTTSPTPTPSPANASSLTPVRMSQEEVYLEYQTTPVVYEPGWFGAPDPGRNIFAFYEPPPPTPYVTPPEKPTPPPTPPPTPEPPPQTIRFITPQSVYAGSKTFRLDVSGDGFTPETRIIFNGSQLPTVYLSPQQLSAEIPSSMILGEGPRQILTSTPDGKLYSNPFTMNIEAPPKPKFQYIGMIARKHYNNDTAYFQEEGNNKEPTGARLNDVVGDRFRIVSISAKEVVLEDVSLGFRHKLALYDPPPGQGRPSGNNFPSRPPTSYQQYTPPNPQQYIQPQIPVQQQEIPGIPSNIPRYNPTPGNQQRPPSNRQRQKDDDDDDDPDDGDGRPE